MSRARPRAASHSPGPCSPPIPETRPAGNGAPATEQLAAGAWVHIAAAARVCTTVATPNRADCLAGLGNPTRRGRSKETPQPTRPVWNSGMHLPNRFDLATPWRRVASNDTSAQVSNPPDATVVRGEKSPLTCAVKRIMLCDASHFVQKWPFRDAERAICLTVLGG